MKLSPKLYENCWTIEIKQIKKIDFSNQKNRKKSNNFCENSIKN